MKPIPPSVGQLKFYINRNNSGLNKLQPTYTLNIEKARGGDSLLVLYAKKFFFKKGSYFLISLQKTGRDKRVQSSEEEINHTIGKLRNIDGFKSKFCLYDAGENFNM